MNKKVSKSLQVVIITILLKIYILYYSNELKRYILILTKCMGGSAFLRKGVLFVYFCKTGSLLGYENGGKGSNIKN